jgi:hypothetical protein
LLCQPSKACATNFNINMSANKTLSKNFFPIRIYSKMLMVSLLQDDIMG